MSTGEERMGCAGGLELKHKIQDPAIMKCPKFKPRPWQQFSVTASPDNKHCPLNKINNKVIIY